MKSSFFNLRLVILLAALLFILVLTQSIFEYRSSRKAVEDLMRNQAEALISSVARAGEKGLIAYQIQQRKITDHLLTLTRSVGELETSGKLEAATVKRLFGSESLLFVGLWDKSGRFQRDIFKNPKIGDKDHVDSALVAPVIEGQAEELRLGMVELGREKVRSLAVAVKRRGGGAVVVGIDAAELLALRQTFGTGSIIDHISQSPGVEYAAILKDGVILAASKGFPAEEMDSWSKDDSLLNGETRTRIRKSPGSTSGSVFEIIGSFTVAGENYGSIMLGLSTTYLSTLTIKLQRDILWRSILFLIIAVIAITGVTIKQNYRLITARYDEIKKEVGKLEADKAQSEKLAAMGELASGVAHEVRNPLNAVRVIVQRLQREFEPAADKAEYRELTDLLINETDRINQTIKQFLTMARPQKINKSRGDIAGCLTAISTLVESRASARGCVIEKNLQKITDFDFDQELCKQGILNLLDNALNAVGDDGKIRINAYARDKKCYIEVEDNGPGIPDENKYRVFDMYFTTRDAGTGMGLPIVMRIVKEHGGTIELSDSELGGALFRMELPLE